MRRPVEPKLDAFADVMSQAPRASLGGLGQAANPFVHLQRRFRVEFVAGPSWALSESAYEKATRVKVSRYAVAVVT